MFSVNAVHWIIQGLQVSYLSFYIHEGMLMFNSVNGSGKIFDVIKILLYLVELMTSVNVENRIVKVLQICNLPFNVHEDVLVLHRVYWTGQILQCLNFSLDLVEVVPVVNILPDWEVHLLEGVEALHDFVVLVFSLNLVHGIVE